MWSVVAEIVVYFSVMSLVGVQTRFVIVDLQDRYFWLWRLVQYNLSNTIWNKMTAYQISKDLSTSSVVYFVPCSRSDFLMAAQLKQSMLWKYSHSSFQNFKCPLFFFLLNDDELKKWLSRGCSAIIAHVKKIQPFLA